MQALEISNMGRTIPALGRKQSGVLKLICAQVAYNQRIAISVTNLASELLLVDPFPSMKRLKTGPIKSEAKRKLVVLITENEKVSNFRNSASSSRTAKTIAQALRRGAPVAIRTDR